ncbi:MAG: hypothetical protein AMS18_02910 [Gemmatimonas sp. SG8_17]|nr:MAG: hypothetical protein AMS18_02910 [Gemmatimonas sp. SG8_17]
MAAGRISGRVVGTANGQPVAQAQVSVQGMLLGTTSDLDGRYLLTDVPAGSVEINVRKIGFAPKTIINVGVEGGETTELDVSLENVVVALETVTVTASAERGTTRAMLDKRRTSDAVLDAMGSFEIKQIPASDAADVAKRMSGVTVSEGRFVYVRGLGDRYSQTTLNGSSLPSPEPEREVVPLDLFPSSFLESVSTQKTYTPDRPGEFSGGSVEISTKELPERFSASIGVGTGFNTVSHFRQAPNFLTYQGGGKDWLGVDDGTRGLPQYVEQQLGGLAGNRLPADPQSRLAAGPEFPRQFNPTTETTPINRSVDFSLGTRSSVLGRDVGLVLGLTYNDDYQVRENEIERKYRASSFDPTVPEDRRVPNIDYTFARGTRSVRIGAIGNLTVLATPTNKISLRTTFNRNTDDEARQYAGTNREDLGGPVRSDRLRFVSRELHWGQLSGEHQTILGSRLEWRAAIARASRDEPGLREALYLNSTTGDPNDPYYLENVGTSGRYLWSKLTDDDQNFELDWQIPFVLWSDLSGYLKVGGAYRDRTRDFAARRFGWSFLGGIVEDIEQDLTSDNIVGGNPGPNQFAINEVVEPGDQYQAFDRRQAGYLMFEIPLSNSLRAILGARVENYNMDIESRGDTVSGIDETDVLPAVNLVWKLRPSMNLRAAYSGTVDRPEFRELAPFQFTEAASLRQLFGNPDLLVTKIQSVDLRWDWFRRTGELISVSAFYKHLDAPIEQVFIAAASTAYSFQNAENGSLYGLEFDARQRLDVISSLLQDFSAQGNLSLVNSEVNVIESGTFVPTNTVRPLEGQSSYSLNLGLVYQSPTGATEIGTFYSRFGERLTAAGGSGVPDIYEQPRNQVDATVRQTIAGGLRMKLKASNLLNAAYVYTQEANGIVQIQREYKTGVSFSVGLSHEF